MKLGGAQEDLGHSGSRKSFIEGRTSRYLAWAMLLAPVAMSLLYVYACGTNICWADQIGAVGPLFSKWYNGTLGFWDFWTPNNEHRHTVPTMVMFALGLLTRWNTLAEMYLVQCTLAAALGMHLFLFLRQCGRRSLWLAVPIAFLVFSLGQFQNMLVGYQFAFVFVGVAAMAAFLCLHLMQSGGKLLAKYLAACAFATLATFSAGQGILAWPVGLMQLAVLPVSWRRKAAFSGLWLAAGGMEAAAYYWRFPWPSGHPPWAFSAEFLLTYIGGSLFPTAPISNSSGSAMRVLAPIANGALVAPAGGAILLLASVAACLAIARRDAARQSYWLALIAFGLLIAVQVTVGRSGFGVAMATSSSRYATYSLLLVIGAYGILTAASLQKQSLLNCALWRCLMIVIAAGLVLSTGAGWLAGRDIKGVQAYYAFVFRTYQSQPDEVFRTVAGIYAPRVRPCLDFLKPRHWNIFADEEAVRNYELPAASLPVARTSARTGGLPQFRVDKETGCVTASGWVVDAEADHPVGGVYLDIDGVSYPVYYGMRRDDAVEALHNSAARYSGFKREFSPRQLPAGMHRVGLKVLAKDRGSFLQISPPAEVRIGP